MSDWDDEPSVILSAGPVRVDTSDPDPGFRPRKVGFLAPLTAEQHEAARTLSEVGPDVLRRMVEHLTPIADQDPDVWGDQA